MLRLSRANRGFTLIEVLIALLVLAIGLLGMATLMMTSMQSSQGASLRSAATVAAYDLAERMRSNPSQSAIANSPYEANPATAVSPACEADANGCSAADLVQADLAEWWLNLQNAIPGAEATVDQVNANTFCLVIFWQEPGTVIPDAATPCGVDADDRAFYTMQVIL